MEKISYEDFSKIELRLAEIISAERVVGSEKLLQLEVNLGSLKTSEDSDESFDPAQDKKTRQIIAGIGKVYEPEKLIGKKIVIVANLEPRKLMGLESQGMLLAASADNHGPVLLVPDNDEIVAGATIR